MTYKVELTARVVKFLKTVPRDDKDKINERLKQISKNPRSDGVIKLSGSTNDEYRVQQGDYRIIFTINDNVLLVRVIDVNHRKDVYR